MVFGIIHGFDWDGNNWPKCGKHGVSKAEIEGLFAASPLTFPDSIHSNAEERFKAIGKSINGRFVYLNFALRKNPNGETLIRPISAPFMHQKEIDQYEQS
jgi:uncharacterized protein